MNKIYLQLGSNLKERFSNIENSMFLLQKTVGNITKKSDYFETNPWGHTQQPKFINLVIEIESPLKAQEVLKECLSIEDKLGRVRTKKWGSRIIDIDILFFNQDIINQPNLIIPHPFIQDRNFVLIPLNQIASELVHPILQKSIKHIKENCTDKEKVVKYEI